MQNKDLYRKEEQETMNAFARFSRLVKNDLLHPSEALFRLGPEYRPTGLTAEDLNLKPLSFIIGEHPSEYALSPQMWNAEFKLRSDPGVFLPADIPPEEKGNLIVLLDEALRFGKEHLRVLTVTNPYKIEALKHLKYRTGDSEHQVKISSDAERIGATNQILVGPDNTFNVINSDGRGMANAVESFMPGKETLAGKKVSVVGAGGAARGIIYELTRRVNEREGGKITIFNRTVEKAVSLAREFAPYFPGTEIAARPLTELKGEAEANEILVSSVTEGDPLHENSVYSSLPPGQLIVDANYGAKSVLEQNALTAGRKDLNIHDGRGMVVEGYIIPSQELASLWGYQVPGAVYQEIGKMFGYSPKAK